MNILQSREKLTLAHELIYQLKIKDAMTREVIFFSEDATFREVQQSLKNNKISGVPILDETKKVIGIISIDDVITALDENYITEKIKDYMSKDVITIPQDHSLVSAIKKFEKYKYGRLPVTENAHSQKIVGILTMGDILNHLLVNIQTIAEKVEKEEQESIERTSELAKKPQLKPLRFEVKKADFDNAGRAASTIRKYLQKLNIDKHILRRVSIICYEAEMNISIHSLGGYITLQVEQDRIIITAVDYGPGIHDIEKALKPGFTTASEQIRALGFGAGMGLPNLKKCADKLELESSMKTGTVLKAIIYLEDSK